MEIPTRKTFKNLLTEGLSKLGQVAFPVYGLAKKTQELIEAPRKKAEEQIKKSTNLYQQATQQIDKAKQNELLRQSLNLSQQASQLAQQSASRVPKAMGTINVSTRLLGTAIPSTGTVANLGKSISGSTAGIITSKLLPEQTKAVEEQRLKDIVKTYRTKYPEANIPTSLPLTEQEKAYRQYISSTYSQKFKPTMPAGYKEPTTILGQTWEGIQSGILNTLVPAVLKSSQSVLNELGLYDTASKLEQANQYVQSYAKSRLDLQAPDFGKVFKENPAQASKLFVARAFGETVPYTASIVAAPLVTRKVNYWTTVAPIQMIEKGNFLRDIEDTVEDKNLANNLATIYGGLNAIIENSLGYTPAGLAKWLSQPVQKVSQTAFINTIKNLPKNTLKLLLNSANEGMEEVAQQVVEDILRKWAGDKSVQTTFSELAENWLGGFAGSLPLGVTQAVKPVSQVGLTVEPYPYPEVIGEKGKNGSVVEGITPMENSYVVNLIHETGETEGKVMTPEMLNEYIKENYPNIQAKSNLRVDKTSATWKLQQRFDELQKQNERISSKMETLEDKGQDITPEYFELEEKRKQIVNEMAKVYDQLNPAPETVKPVEEVKPTEKVKPEVVPGVKPEAKPLESIIKEFEKETGYNAKPFSSKEFYKSGAILKNNKIVEIGDDDHSILSDLPEKLTYRFTNNGELYFRIPQTFSKTQLENAIKISPFNFKYVAVDILNKQNKVVNSFDKNFVVGNKIQLKKFFDQLNPAPETPETVKPEPTIPKEISEPTIEPETPLRRTEMLPEAQPPAEVSVAKQENKEVIEKINPEEDHISPPTFTAPSVEKELENYPKAVSKAVKRYAEENNISLDEVPTYTIQNLNQLYVTTKEFYDNLVQQKENIEDYVSGKKMLPPNVSPPEFIEIYIEDNAKSGNIDLVREALSSPIFSTITQSAQLLRQQREATDYYYTDIIKDIQEKKQQKAKKLFGKNIEKKITTTSENIPKVINRITLEALQEKNSSFKNPALIEAIKNNKIDLLELSSMSYKEIVSELSPYIGDAIEIRQAALDLQGKSYLKRVKAGLTNWAKKWAVGRQVVSDKELSEQIDNVVSTSAEKLSWEQKKKEFTKFVKIISGYDLTNSELKEAMRIADDLITAKSTPNFETLPDDDEAVTKFKQAELARFHLITKISGAGVNFGETLKENWEMLTTAWEEKGVHGFIQESFKALNDISIALKANLDNSFIFRQGRFTLFTNPSVWLKGAQKSFEAWFSKNPLTISDAYLLDLFGDKLYRNGWYQKVNVLSELELYPTTLPSKIPIIGPLFTRSELAYKFAQTEMRKGLARDLWNNFQGNEITYKGETRTIDFLSNKEDIAAARQIINVSTASGFKGKQDVSRFIVWSRSLINSELTTVANLIGAKTTPPFQSMEIKQAWQRLMGILVFTYLTQALLKSIRKDEEPIILDPTDQRWGEIYLGKDIKFRDPLLSVVQLSAILVSMGIGRGYKTRTTREWRKPGQYGVDPFTDFVVSYFTNKFTPTVRILVDSINKYQIGGEKITVGRALKSLFVPISLENIYDLNEVEDYRKPSAILAVIADAFGLSTTTMIHHIKLDEGVAKEISRLQMKEIPDLQMAKYSGFINEHLGLTVQENKLYFENITNFENEFLKKLLATEEYQQASDAQKADYIQRMFDEIQQVVKVGFIYKRMEEKQTTKEKADLLERYIKSGFINSETFQDLFKINAFSNDVLQELLNRKLIGSTGAE